MPRCWGPYKYHPLVPPWTDDTGRSLSDKLWANGWIPHCTHYPPPSVPSRSSYLCSRQQTGMRRRAWPESRAGGGKGLVLKPIRFPLKQIYHRPNGTHQYIFSSKRCAQEAQDCFEYVPFLYFQQGRRKSVNQEQVSHIWWKLDL